MIKTFFLMLKMLIVLLPFILMCILNKKVNYEKADRSRQYFMPVVTFVYVILTMIFLNRINSGLLILIDNIPKWIVMLSQTLLLPQGIGNVLSSLGTNLAALFEKINMKFWIFFISNTAIFAAYLSIKKLCLGIMKRKNNEESQLHMNVAGHFYEFFSEKNKWCLQNCYVQARQFLRMFYYTAVVISIVLMLISREFYYEELIRTVFYPIFGILILGELYFYLDGLTKKEYSEIILGEDEEAYKTVNYTLLRKFLRNIFEDKLLAENTSVNSDLFNDITNDEIIQKFEKSEDPKVNTFALYYKALNDTGFDIDQNYIFSSLDLLEGKSVLFNNPFYNDLIPYAFYPINRMLLSHKKVLIVLGRHSIEEDIISWVKDGISAITNIPFLWKINVLNEENSQETDIGIITRSDVSNINLHNANSDFLEKVGFVVILEPSKLISTAQIGLSLIIAKCKCEADKKITYCICDKNCDGLVDAMSHILKTSLTEVSATKKHRGTSSYMCWEADADYLHHRLVPNISRYLGMGTELSFAALKNQISKTKWYGGEVFPVIDMHWIVRQYYYDLMKYAGLPTNQDALEERFKTSSNYWSARIEKHNYFTIEDESYNMFEILRNFSTRSTEQGFINVISSEYLLKDYMTQNASIFETDAKAIPRIVADFVRSTRNVTLKLILMMSTYPVEENIIEKELSLIGIEIFNLKKQLWYEIYRCYSDINTLKDLPSDYKVAVEKVSELSISFAGEDAYNVDISVLYEADNFSLKTGKVEHTVEIIDKLFLNKCVRELQSAGYISEDEQGDKYYIGAELIGHIYQKFLPGQFFTFGGKYYEMRYLTPEGKILVRRAADHIVGRPCYRQIRDYKLTGLKISEQIGAVQNISGLKVTKEYADICVSTQGYYKMDKYNDFLSAKKVIFEGKKSGIPDRIYFNKEIIKIELPSDNNMLSDDIRYTVTTLFNEVFRTLFAENEAYIVATTDDSHVKEDAVKPLTYSLKAQGCETDKNCIYIIEDSQLDLGLTVAVERNLQRILEIINDYIDWHIEAIDNSLNPPQEPEMPISYSAPENDTQKRKSIFGKIGDLFKKLIQKIKSIFKKKTKKDKGQAEKEAEQNGDSAEQPEQGEKATDDEKIPVQNTANKTEVQNLVEASDDEIVYITEDEKVQKNPLDFSKEAYHKRYYMLYGGSEVPSCIDVAGAIEYLSLLGFDRNPLKKARDGKKIADLAMIAFNPDKVNVKYCDFCGCEIYGVEYETLSDGRERCLNCGRTAIKTGKEFQTIFEDVKRNLESFFGISIKTGIRVEMVNAKKLHRNLGKTFIPTPKSDGRILGVAINDKSGYTLMVENGSPRMASMLTMAHELTHIWQYLNWNDKDIVKKYGKQLRLEVYEGMAKWVEIQYAYLINEHTVAKREEIITAYRQDEYGRGFLRYLANYPFSLGPVVVRDTPFMFVEQPLDPQYCGEISYVPQNPSDLFEGEDKAGGEGNKGSERKRPTPKVKVKGSNERTPDSIAYYALKQLNASEKAVYCDVLTAINDLVKEITVFSANVSDEQIKKIVNYVQIDHPEIFWFRNGITYFFDSATHIVNKVEFKYCMTKDEKQKRVAKMEQAIAPFLSSVNERMCDYDAALKIYENIISLVDYDSINLEKQKNSEMSAEVPDDLRSIYGVFVNKKAVCAGYAKATQYLLNRIGIECTYVTSESHAWNLVKLEGDYYYLDTTWGDGSNTEQNKHQSDRIDYDCFCITTKEIARLDSHKPNDDIVLPECTAVKCNYFYRQGLCYDKYDFESVRAVFLENISSGNLNISLKCTDDAVFDKFKKELINNCKLIEIIKYNNLKSKTKIKTECLQACKIERRILSFYLKKQ